MPAYSPITFDHEFFIDVDKTFEFTVKDEDGTVVDISSWALSFKLYSIPLSVDQAAEFEKTTSAGITITDGPNGVCQVAVEDVDTEDLVGGRHENYYYELRRTGAGTEHLLAYGPVVLRLSPY